MLNVETSGRPGMLDPTDHCAVAAMAGRQLLRSEPVNYCEVINQYLVYPLHNSHVRALMDNWCLQVRVRKQGVVRGRRVRRQKGIRLVELRGGGEEGRVC